MNTTSPSHPELIAVDANLFSGQNLTSRRYIRQTVYPAHGNISERAPSAGTGIGCYLKKKSIHSQSPLKKMRRAPGMSFFEWCETPASTSARFQDCERDKGQNSDTDMLGWHLFLNVQALNLEPKSPRMDRSTAEEIIATSQQMDKHCSSRFSATKHVHHNSTTVPAPRFLTSQNKNNKSSRLCEQRV